MQDIKLLEKYAAENNVPIMQKDGIDFLVNYINENNYQNILEIGTAIGYSAIMIALSSGNITLDTVEINKQSYNIAVENISSFNLQDQITVFNQDALEFETDKEYDLIFLDAAKAKYQKMFDRFIGNLKPNGTVVIDNLEFHGLVNNPEQIKSRNTRQLVRKIKQFRDNMLSDSKYETIYLADIGDGLLIVSKK